MVTVLLLVAVAALAATWLMTLMRARRWERLAREQLAWLVGFNAECAQLAEGTARLVAAQQQLVASRAARQ